MDVAAVGWRGGSGVKRQSRNLYLVEQRYGTFDDVVGFRAVLVQNAHQCRVYVKRRCQPFRVVLHVGGHLRVLPAEPLWQHERKKRHPFLQFALLRVPHVREPAGGHNKTSVKGGGSR